MRVLHVCAYAARYGGNFIASLQQLDQLLLQQGIESMYLFPDSAKDTAWCQALQQNRTVFFAGLNRFRFSTFLQIKTAMESADIIHSHFELYDCLCSMALKKGQKLFWHLHDSFDENIDTPHRILNRLQYGLLGRKARLITPNQFYGDYTIQLGFPAKQVHVVENGICLQRLQSSQTMPEKRYDFFAYGGIYRVKGLDVLLDACRILDRKGYSFSVGIVGYPDTWTYMDTHYPDLADHMIRETPSEDVRLFYSAAHVFVSASRRECFSYALLEALYMRCPVIASDIPGSRWAKRFQTVQFFQTENAAALADRMEQFLPDRCVFTPEALTQTSEQIKAQYSAANWAAQIKEIYFRD